MRIGQGFDVHKFGGDGPITIGGVKIDYSEGLEAHSDGDVLLHALCDAILGALALGDIGQHFPDTDDSYANADSRELLRHIMALATDHGYRVINADMTIIAQAPKMAPHIKSMRERIAQDCQCAADAINVKATTSEGLGFTGRQEGIAAQAVVLMDNL